MTDTLTAAKSLVKQTPGGNANTWGAILNSTLDLVDKALGQTLTKALAGNVTLTATEIQNVGFNFTGALAGSVTVTFPTFYGPAIIRNKTTGGFSIVVGMASGTTVTVGDNTSALVFSDGTDFASTNSDAGNITTGTVPAARLPSIPASLLPAPASVNGGVTAPAATSSPTAVMMGLGSAWFFTPSSTGKAMVIISGDAANSLNGGFTYQIRYGTGAAPANGAALTGSPGSATATNVPSTGFAVPFSTQFVATGLALGTPYWFDLALAVFGSGAASLTNLTISALES
jgi:hypothetical protein